MEGNNVTPTNNDGKTMAVVSLVLGIVSIVGSFIPGIGVIAFICSIVGIVLAAKARKVNKSGIATGGLVCSIIGCVFGAFAVICALACVGVAGAAGLFDYIK